MPAKGITFRAEGLLGHAYAVGEGNSRFTMGLSSGPGVFLPFGSRDPAI
jgi:hypothetical protein